MSDTTVPSGAPGGGMSGGRIALIVIGSLLALLGFTLAAGGGALLVANGTLRDDEGFFTTSTERFATTGRALASDDLSVVEGSPVDVPDDNLATIRLRVTSVDPGRPVFVGIARADDVDRYLSGVDHDRILNADFDPFRVDYSRRTGSIAPAAPTTAAFWVATATGSGRQALRWDVSSGTWSVVIMNADGSPGVAVEADAGAKIKYLVTIAIGLLSGGLVLLGGGVTMIIFGARSPRGPNGPPAPIHAEAALTGVGATRVDDASPVLLEGRLDETQSRWMWLVKWLLAIPHWIVLAFLWLALWVLSVGAFFAILFTGRYPRGIFDFNLGVLRWTWRVSFYSYSALGTDRYPPFTLADVPDYPARFDVAYPERLSRGLVLIKWWLLAIPHLVIVAVFTGGWALGAPGPWGFADNDAWGWGNAPGLLGVLVVIAGFALLFTGRYPRGLFDLAMGVNRWVYRVVAYVGLMRDEYPPFRLDLGEREPGRPLGPPSGGSPPPPENTPPTAEIDERERSAVR